MPRCQLGIRMCITKRFSSQILTVIHNRYNASGKLYFVVYPVIFLMMQRSFRSAALLERALNATRAE